MNRYTRPPTATADEEACDEGIAGVGGVPVVPEACRGGRGLEGRNESWVDGWGGEGAGAGCCVASDGGGGGSVSGKGTLFVCEFGLLSDG